MSGLSSSPERSRPPPPDAEKAPTHSPEASDEVEGPSSGRWGRARLLLSRSWAPLALLAVISVLSLGVRSWGLDRPCSTPCASGQDHALIFDEVYYVNAARRIDGFSVPAGGRYLQAPAGLDPNAEHPQLGKLIIAGSMRLFGDAPLGWRFGSLIVGSIAILGVYALVRASGGSRWLGTGVAGLMAVDNLLMVHGRIGTLDIYVLTLMLWAVVLYVKGRHLSAGLLLGVGTCVKLVAPYALLVLLVVEVLRHFTASRLSGGPDPRRRWQRQLRGYISCAVASAAVYLALLALMDHFVPAYDTIAGVSYRDPFAHTLHMVRFAASLSDPSGAHGIASYPWQWLGDYKPIVYLNVDTSHVVNGHTVLDSTTHFLGVVNPLTLLFAIPAFLLGLSRIRRSGSEIDIVGVAWCVGTFVPFVLQSAIGHRISYLYYMVIIMPGVYLLVARFVAGRRMPRWARGLWGSLMIIAAVLMYPLITLPDPNWV